MSTVSVPNIAICHDLFSQTKSPSEAYRLRIGPVFAGSQRQWVTAYVFRGGRDGDQRMEQWNPVAGDGPRDATPLHIAP